MSLRFALFLFFMLSAICVKSKSTGFALIRYMNTISDLFIRFSQMRYEIKGIVNYAKKVWKKFNFRLILGFNLQSNILSFFAEIIYFSSIRIFSSVNLSYFSWKSYERRVFILMCMIMNMIVIRNLIYKSFHHFSSLLYINSGNVYLKILLYGTKAE